MESNLSRLGFTRKPIAWRPSRTSHWLRAGPAGSSVYMKVCRLRLAGKRGAPGRPPPAPPVAGVHEGLAAGRLHLTVQLLELGEREVDLAADLEGIGQALHRFHL